MMRIKHNLIKSLTHAMNRKMGLLLKHLGKHKIGEYDDEHIRKHIRSPHTRGSSPYGGSHPSYEFTNGLYNNLGKMNLGSNSIA